MNRFNEVIMRTIFVFVKSKLTIRTLNGERLTNKPQSIYSQSKSFRIINIEYA